MNTQRCGIVTDSGPCCRASGHTGSHWGRIGSEGEERCAICHVKQVEPGDHARWCSARTTTSTHSCELVITPTHVRSYFWNIECQYVDWNIECEHVDDSEERSEHVACRLDAALQFVKGACLAAIGTRSVVPNSVHFSIVWRDS